MSSVTIPVPISNLPPATLPLTGAELVPLSQIGNTRNASVSSIAASLPPFSSAAPGIVPASGGGTANFLRADGSWSPPSGFATPISLANGGTGTALTALQNGVVVSGASALSILATGNNGVLVTSSGGAPSISSTLPNAVQGNITAIGTLTSLTVSGNVSLNGSTSGSATVRVAAAAGATTFQLPVGNGTGGFVLQTDGAGVTSWAAAGGGGGALVLISTQIASNSATLQWTALGSTYTNYKLVISSLIPAISGDNFFLQFGEGPGPTWQTGISYATAIAYVAGFTVGGVNNVAADGFGLTAAKNVNTGAGAAGFSGDVTIQNIPANNSGRTTATWISFIDVTTTSAFATAVGAGYVNDTTAKTGVRIFAATGNIISGSASLYGLAP